jgi:adenylate cyclase
MKVRILVVDDEPDVLSFLSKRLEAHGYEVVTASGAEEGVRTACERKPSLILLDIIMPGKDGLWAFKELKAAEATKDIPVLMLTAKSESSDILAFQELGATDYLIKPFELQTLLKYIRKYTA